MVMQTLFSAISPKIHLSANVQLLFSFWDIKWFCFICLFFGHVYFLYNKCKVFVLAASVIMLDSAALKLIHHLIWCRVALSVHAIFDDGTVGILFNMKKVVGIGHCTLNGLTNWLSKLRIRKQILSKVCLLRYQNKEVCFARFQSRTAFKWIAVFDVYTYFFFIYDNTTATMSDDLAIRFR